MLAEANGDSKHARSLQLHQRISYIQKLMITLTIFIDGGEIQHYRAKNRDVNEDPRETKLSMILWPK